MGLPCRGRAPTYRSQGHVATSFDTGKNALSSLDHREDKGAGGGLADASVPVEENDTRGSCVLATSRGVLAVSDGGPGPDRMLSHSGTPDTLLPVGDDEDMDEERDAE